MLYYQIVAITITAGTGTEADPWTVITNDALKTIELIGKSLATAVNDGSNEEALEKIALANTIAGMVESTSGCTSEHLLEHAMSAKGLQISFFGVCKLLLFNVYYS